MFKEETKELKMSNEFRKKIEMICKFAYVKYEIINGNIISIKNTSLAYVRPHILKVKGNDYLLFEDSKCGSFFGSKTTKKKLGKKYYYYKCEHCYVYITEDIIEEKLIDSLINLQKKEELLNDYYTPFIKSKLDNNIEDFKKELNDLNKQIDRIKTAYIKGITKLDYFEKELNQIEFKKLKNDNKLKIGIITLDVSEIKKMCTPKVYDFIMNSCEEYKKDFKNFISKISI